jgi:hypothetical protein
LGAKDDLIERFVIIKYIGIWSNALVSTLLDPQAPHTAGIVLSRLVTISFLRKAPQILSALNGCLKNLSVEFRVFFLVLQENSKILFAIHDGVTLTFYRRKITSEEQIASFNNFINRSYWRMRSKVAFSV